MRQAAQMLADGREHGYIVCNAQGRLVVGPESVGTISQVSINVQCPAGARPLAIFHTHPMTGDIQPSAKDMGEAARLRIPWVCVGIPETGRVQCYRVPRVPS